MPGTGTPPPPPMPPTDHTLIYFVVSTICAATVGGIVLHYLKFYDPMVRVKAFL